MATKKHNGPGDVVLVHIDGKAAAYARIEDLRAHARAGWYECDLLLLAEPIQPVTWILERAQIDGTPFTMGGRPVQIEALPELGSFHSRPAAKEPAASHDSSQPAGPARGQRRGNVVPLFPGSPADKR